MRISFLTAVQIILAIIVVSAAIYFALGLRGEKTCPQVSLQYSACHDSLSETILLKVSSSEKSPGTLNIQIGDRQVRIAYLPKKQNTYLIKAEKDPGTITSTFESSGNCSYTQSIPLSQCNAQETNLSLRISLKPVNNITSQNNSLKKSDVLSQNLVNQSGFNVCNSEWTCESWEECISGVQRRDCTDKNNCLTPTNTLEFTRACNECKEDWQCEWSECANNYTNPECTDANKCGTEFSKPKGIPCLNQKESCVPNISCSEWSNCAVISDIESLSAIENIRGKRFRICSDTKSCISDTQESESCSLRSEIYAEIITLCGKDYLEVYDNRSTSLLARLYYAKERLDILFTGKSGEYCEI